MGGTRRWGRGKKRRKGKMITLEDEYREWEAIREEEWDGER